MVAGHLVSPRADPTALSLGHSYGHQRRLDGRGCFSSTQELFRSGELLSSTHHSPVDASVGQRLMPLEGWGAVTDSSISEAVCLVTSHRQQQQPPYQLYL